MDGERHLDLRLPPDEVLRRVEGIADEYVRIDVAGGRFTVAARADTTGQIVVDGSVVALGGEGARVAVRGRPGDDLDSRNGIIAGLVAAFYAVVLAGVVSPWFLVAFLGPIPLLVATVRAQGRRTRDERVREAFARLEEAFADVAKLPAVGAAPAQLPPGPAPFELGAVVVHEYLPSESVELYATASLPAARGLRLRISHGYVYPIERALGAQDDAIGDPTFDERFIVRANDLPFARAWLSAGIRAELLALADVVAVSLDDGELRLGVVIEPPPPGRQRIFALARLFAGRARELLDDWRTVAGALGGRLRSRGDGWAPDGSSAIDVERGGVTVSIDATLARTGVADPQLFTRLCCDRVALEEIEVLLCARGDDLERRSYGPLVEVPLGDASLDGAYWLRVSPAARSLVTPALARQVAACRPDRLRVDAEGVRVYLRGFESDAGRLAAACDLAAAVATHGAGPPSAGPYR